MKKILFFAVVFLAAASVAVAAENQRGNQGESGSVNAGINANVDDSDLADDSAALQDEANEEVTQVLNQNMERNQERTANQGEETQLKIKNTAEWKNFMETKKEALSQEIENITDEAKQKVWRNQNTVREAVQALLASKDLIGGIGQQVSAIANEFNNSVEKTLAAEEQIQKRSRIREFFNGGDKTAANAIKEEVDKNQERIQELKNLWQSCGCQEELKSLLQEQVKNLEQEQNRLGELAREQADKKGVFGWLFGWLKK